MHFQTREGFYLCRYVVTHACRASSTIWEREREGGMWTNTRRPNLQTHHRPMCMWSCFHQYNIIYIYIYYIRYYILPYMFMSLPLSLKQSQSQSQSQSIPLIFTRSFSVPYSFDTTPMSLLFLSQFWFWSNQQQPLICAP